MSRKITFLVDNRAEKPFFSEHGLSMLLEIGGKRLLFDTGQGKTLFHNAEKLGVSLSGLDALVLSHGHYDHGGNLDKILALNPSTHFFAHPDCLLPRWSLQPGKSPKQIGLSQENKKAVMSLSPAQLHWCEKPAEIIPGVWITGTVPRKSRFEDVGGSFYQDETGNTPDLLFDDISLWVEGESGCTVVCGCCHSGVKNTLDHIVSQLNGMQINSLVGGFHLLHAKRERITKTISCINETGIKKVVPAHCTGDAAMVRLEKNLDAEVQPGMVGLQIDM